MTVYHRPPSKNGHPLARAQYRYEADLENQQKEPLKRKSTTKKSVKGAKKWDQ